MKRIVAIALGVVLLAGLASLAGGSMIWWMLGVRDDLAIEGRAQAVAPPDPAATTGWPTYGGDSGGSRYSAAAQINRETVAGLDVAWTYRTRTFDRPGRDMGDTAFEATPILAGDKLVLCTPYNEVIAIDPGTGEELWRHDPGVDPGRNPGNQYVCRGVSQWTDTLAPAGAPCRDRIFTGTVDGRILALDLANGKPCSGFGTRGEVSVAPDMPLIWLGEFQITSAPAVVGDIVVTGSAISDNNRVAAPHGKVFGIDARTGEKKWIFDPIPRDPADPARATWGGTSADTTGHANVWSTISVDPKRGWVFLPTSSPSPDFFGGLRPGNNDRANSVVALEAATGRVVWSFQTVHHDVWDYDVPAQPGLYTITLNGAPREVVVQATKTSLLFVLDRDTGEPVIPVEERPTPQGGVPGEALSPTQPFPTRPAPIAPDRIGKAGAFGVTWFDKQACAKRLGGLRAEGLFTPPTEQGTLIMPFNGGGSNWGGIAFDASRNLAIVNVSNLAHEVRLIPPDSVASLEYAREYDDVSPQTGAPFAMTRDVVLSPLGLPCNPPPWGMLAAVDVAKGEIVWRRVIGDTRDLAPFGLAIKTGTPNLGGPMVTAGGLVFLAATFDSQLRAFDIETGKMLWSDTLPASGQATPMTYVWEGRQYVVLASGGYGNFDSPMGDYVTAWALPQDASRAP
jgi:quinoprotein glucose dehydrogenase